MSFEKLVTILKEHLDNDAVEITENTTFQELGIDSLDTVDMVMQLEEELEIELELDEGIKTVGALAKLVDSKLNEKE